MDPDQPADPPAGQVTLDVQHARVLHLSLVILVHPRPPDPVPQKPVDVGLRLLQAGLHLLLPTKLHLDADLLLVLLLGAHLLVLLLLVLLPTAALVPLLRGAAAGVRVLPPRLGPGGSP